MQEVSSEVMFRGGQFQGRPCLDAPRDAAHLQAERPQIPCGVKYDHEEARCRRIYRFKYNIWPTYTLYLRCAAIDRLIHYADKTKRVWESIECVFLCEITGLESFEPYCSYTFAYTRV